MNKKNLQKYFNEINKFYYSQFLLFQFLAFAQSYIKDMKRDSARSDTRTGGQIEKAALIPGGQRYENHDQCSGVSDDALAKRKGSQNLSDRCRDEGISDVYRFARNKYADLESVAGFRPIRIGLPKVCAARRFHRLIREIRSEK